MLANLAADSCRHWVRLPTTRRCQWPNFGSVDIEQLAVKAADGDQRALEALLAQSQPIVMTHCRRFLPNHLDAEEATQDALLSISRAIGGFAGRSKYTTWIYPICTNASIDCYRKLKRRKSVLGVEPDREVAAAGSTPSVVMGARISVLEAAEQLDPDVVELVLMRDLLDMDYDEMATVRDTNVSTIRWQVAEGRKKMKRLLSPLNN